MLCLQRISILPCRQELGIQSPCGSCETDMQVMSFTLQIFARRRAFCRLPEGTNECRTLPQDISRSTSANRRRLLPLRISNRRILACRDRPLPHKRNTRVASVPRRDGERTESESEHNANEGDDSAEHPTPPKISHPGKSPCCALPQRAIRKRKPSSLRRTCRKSRASW